MARKGRKGYGEELQILRRYSDLAEPYFLTLKEWLEGDDKEEKKDAIKALSPAFAKMIPQDVSADVDGDITITIAKEVADKYETTSSTG